MGLKQEEEVEDVQWVQNNSRTRERLVEFAVWECGAQVNSRPIILALGPAAGECVDVG